ncbi:MAG: acyltransferase [Candidatus Moraniibacteriota bacterium]
MEKQNYLSSLTSLRGLAALLVVLLHFNVFCFALAPWDGPFDHFIQKGYLWVDFFFLLSGFIMMHVYSESFNKSISENFFTFMRSRFARIYPLHLFSFLCMVVFYFWYRANFTLSAADYVYTFNMHTIWANLFLLQSMGLYKILTWNSPSWSISVEWWMYVVFPFLLVPFRKITGWKRIYIFFGIVAGYLFIIYFLYPISALTNGALDPGIKYSLDVTYDFGFIRCFFGFLFGMLLYELYRVDWGRKYLSKNSVWLLITIIVVMVMTFSTPDIVPIIAFAAIILASVYAEGFCELLLSLKPLVYLGTISYSVYIMHFLLMTFLFDYLKKFSRIKMEGLDWPTAWLYALAYLAIVILISSLTYRFVEVPLRQKINRAENKK